MKFFDAKNFFAAIEWTVNDLLTVDDSNSVKFKTTFVDKYTTYLTLTERVNTFVMIYRMKNKTRRLIAVSVGCVSLYIHVIVLRRKPGPKRYVQNALKKWYNVF